MEGSDLFKILTEYSPEDTEINVVKSPDRTVDNTARIKSKNTSLERYHYTNQFDPNSLSPEIGSELVFMPKEDEYGLEKITKLLVETSGHLDKKWNLVPYI